MKNRPDGMSSRSVTIEEKISEVDAIATETQSESQNETQKDKWTGPSAVEQLQVA